MPKYRFIVKAASGKVRRGSITEKDEAGARKQLEDAGFEIVSLSEGTDLVVHQQQAQGGRAKHRPSRAAIIDFEETLGEKIQNFFNRYVLRREAAAVIGVVGFIWIVVSSIGSSDETQTKELEYKPYKVEVKVSVDGFEADKVKVRLPDVLTSNTEEIKEEEPVQTVVLDFDAAQTPEKVQVELLEGGRVIAKAEGILKKDSEQNFSFAPTLEKVRDR